ncbi:MAG: DUF1704 domain-containing protein [Sandaracinus sp.]|nr:DUF1704 domain-containing protein [Sandaracinus sp.]MCB9622794.1 DUF1704 domain-containing protein [Sandaracinus sp.]
MARSRAQLELDARLRHVAEAAMRLPSLVARGGKEERARLVERHRRGERLAPSWSVPADPVTPDVRRALSQARRFAGEVAAEPLYLARLEELELELDLRDALGSGKTVRALARRRWPTGRTPIHPRAKTPLRAVADALLDDVATSEDEPATVPARGEGSLEAMVLRVAAVAGLSVQVKVEPGLVARAAAGERTVFLADTRFGAREARRLAIHEVLGHLVAAANARSQPLALLSVGTAGSFEDQEGLALSLEEHAGLMDARRARTFAARVVATDAVHEGADPDEVVELFVRDRGLTLDDAIAITERAFRGGGLARDAGYLYGWLRVRRALRREETRFDELRWGKVGLDALGPLRALAARGELREPGPHRPSLASSLDATGPGTSSFTSPPSVAASLMRFDET